MMLTFEYIIFIVITLLLHILVLYFVTRKQKKSLLGRHVVITGGSSGIGLHAAIYCAKLGAHVTIIARNVTLLDKAVELIKANCNPKLQRIQCVSFDLSKSSYQDTQQMLEKTENFDNINNPIFMLVNCAGLAICGTIEEISIDDLHRMMDCNFFGTYYPTRYCLEKMKKNRNGIIVITASQAALMGIYGYGAYGATKFALRGLAETIAMEASHCGVSVTLALPADTDTPGFEQEQKTKPKETKIISGSGGLAKPEDVAKQMIDDALRGTFFSIIGFESWLLTILCSGMAPWGGFGLNVFIAITIAPIKVIGQIIQYNFKRIVRNCAEEKRHENFPEKTTSAQESKAE